MYLYNSNTIPTAEAQASLMKKGQKDCKSQRNREFVFTRNIREATPMKFHQNVCLNKTWTAAPTAIDRLTRKAESERPHPRQRHLGKWETLRVGKIAVYREEPPNQPILRVSPEIEYRWHSKERAGLLLYIGICMCVCVIHTYNNPWFQAILFLQKKK
jgi:hypothetical protein